MFPSFKWLLILIFLHCLHYINSTPLPSQSDCRYFNIGELVKNSPIILKTLAVQVHTNVTEQTTMGNKHKPFSKDIKSARLTLVPETIYRGASLLNLITMRDLNGVSGAYETDGGKEGENFLNQQYRHLNASLQPLECFDTSLLLSLPTEIIAFGKLDSMPIGKYHPVVDGYIQVPFFRFNNDGFRRWTQELENEVWKLLGWDEWSDFSSCSTVCGGGKQQRVRRCLLDNPMINLNQNTFDAKRLHFKEADTIEPRDQSKQDSKKGLHGNLLRKPFKNTDLKSQHSTTMSNVVVDIGHTSSHAQRNLRITNGYATIFCEGFKVEQRGCNTFDCNDMFDVLQTLQVDRSINDITISNIDTTTNKINRLKINNKTFNLQMKGSYPGSLSTESKNLETPSNLNLGINLQNMLSFTILTTFRVQTSDNETTSIFSVSNDTHKMSLKSMENGVLFNLEASGRSVSLPIKFNLGDNHWHQLAISVSNGDFISVHVDCGWTKSVVTSRHLVSMPLNAHIEIGLSQKANLEQLVVLPENNGHHQCSAKRISINEINRYIIGRFEID